MYGHQSARLMKNRVVLVKPFLSWCSKEKINQFSPFIPVVIMSTMLAVIVDDDDEDNEK